MVRWSWRNLNNLNMSTLLFLWEEITWIRPKTFWLFEFFPVLPPLQIWKAHPGQEKCGTKEMQQTINQGMLICCTFCCYSFSPYWLQDCKLPAATQLIGSADSNACCEPKLYRQCHKAVLCRSDSLKNLVPQSLQISIWAVSSDCGYLGLQQDLIIKIQFDN